MNDAVAVVRVRRSLRATPERLFELFTEPRELVKWFGPGRVRCVEANVDLRVGGQYRFEFRAPDGERSVVVGVYREIERPRRLRFSWTWEVWKVAVPAETRVTVELVPAGAMTDVLVTHERFPDERTRSEHGDGWTGTLDCLETYVDSGMGKEIVP